MYATCLFCHQDLGRNEAIEPFPVGRRLAFDAARGRLWVVCTHCRRWNLTPVEERWEAIEECERRYRETRKRVATDEIGLARLAEGLELVRIGRPERPEFAAWRYGEQLGRRRRANLLVAGLGLGALGAVVAGGAAAGIGVASFGYGLWEIGSRIVKGSPDKVITQLVHPDSDVPLVVKRKHLAHVQLLGGDQGGWWLAVPNRKRLWRFEGERASGLVGRMLPAINRFDGTRDQVSDAVRLLEEHADPARFIDGVAAGRALARPGSRRDEAGARRLAALPAEVRVALEMASHEESERRALEGELALLEQAWREAEEIAAIADDMFLPRWLTDRLDALRRAAG